LLVSHCHNIVVNVINKRVIVGVAENAGVENAEVENAGVGRRGRKCRSR